MAHSKEIKVCIDIKDIKKIKEIKNLLHLLENEFDNLPKNIQKSLLEFEKEGFSDFGPNDLEKYLQYHNYNRDDVYVSIKNIVTCNKILKRVMLGDGTYVYPKTFKISVKDNVLIEW